MYGISGANPGTPGTGVFDFDTFAYIRTTDSCRSHEAFVTSETIHVDTGGLHVEINGPGTLTTVNHEDNAFLFTDFPDFGQRLNRSQHVGTMGYDNKFRVRTDGVLYVVGMYIAVCIKRHVS